MRTFFLATKTLSFPAILGIMAFALAAQAFLYPVVFAADPVIYFDVPAKSVTVGEEFAVGIFIDTDQPVNAYEVDLAYSSALFELIGFDNSRSIIDLWSRDPLVYESGKIVIKGGSLQSFTGQRGEVITIRLKARGLGSAEFMFLDPALYLANGKGTKVVPTMRNLTLTIEDGGAPLTQSGDSNTRSEASRDATAPEILQATLIEDPINPDQKLLSFQAKDAGSGIGGIVYEARTWFLWRDAQSARNNPVALSSDVWSARVTAYDNAGNTTTRVVYDWGAFAKGPLVVGAVLLVIIARLLYKTGLRKRTIIEKDTHFAGQ